MAIQGNETVEQPIILPAQDPQYRTIHVSRQKKTVHFFANLTKRFLTTDEIIELSGLGLAIVTVIETTQILRKSGHIYVEGKLFLIPKVFFSNMRLLLTFLTTLFFLPSFSAMQTSLVEPHPEGRSTAPKAKFQIWVRRAPAFDTLMAAAAATRKLGNAGRRHLHNRKYPSGATRRGAGTAGPYSQTAVRNSTD